MLETISKINAYWKHFRRHYDVKYVLFVKVKEIVLITFSWVSQEKVNIAKTYLASSHSLTWSFFIFCESLLSWLHLTTYTLKKKVFSWTRQKGSADVKKLSDVLKETIQKSTKPKMILPLDTREESSLRNLLSSVQNLEEFRRKEPNLGSLCENWKADYKTPKVWFYFYETFSDFVRNLKRFRSEGSCRVSREEPFQVS